MNTVMKLGVLKVKNFFTSMRVAIGYTARVGEAVMRQTPYKND
jgi:hypothetical protein